MSNVKATFKCSLEGKTVPVTLDFGERITLSFPYFKPLIEEVKAMQGAKWHPELKIWSIDNCKRNLFAFDVLSNGPWISRYDRPIPSLTPSLPLWVHQKDMYEFMKDKRRVLLAAEPRTGKTLPTLLTFWESEFDFGWWVTTKSAELGFQRELQKWFPGKIRYAKDALRMRRFDDPDKCKYLEVMTYDKFTEVMSHWPMGKKLPGFIVFDECHKLKTPTSGRTVQALRLSEIIEDCYQNHSEYVIGLSGTPAPKDPSDWWSQCEAIRSGYIREGDINKFKKRYGNYLPWDGSTPAWNRFEGWNGLELGKLSQRLVGLVRVYFKKDCMDLPPPEYVIVNLPPSKTLLRVAKMVADTETSILKARNRLRQLSDGFEYEKEYNETTNKLERSGATFVGSPKIDQLQADLEEYEDTGRVVIYSGFQGSTDICRKTCLECGWAVLQIDGRGREVFWPNGSSTSEPDVIQLVLGEMDRSTDTGKVPKLAVCSQTDAGGTGLEFSSSPVIIYYSNSDSGEGRMQSEERPQSGNMDKNRGVVIKDYIHLPTDKLILDKLRAKKDLQTITMGEFKDLFYNLN